MPLLAPHLNSRDHASTRVKAHLAMKELQFVAQRQADWDQWDRWLRPRLRAQKHALPSKGDNEDGITAAQLSRRFRALCHDLALAQARNYSSELVDGLQNRVLLAHQKFYGAKRQIGVAVVEFFAAEFPAAVRRERKIVCAAALLFFVPLLVMLVIAQYFPDAVYLIISPEQADQFERLYTPMPGGPNRGPITDWNMYAYYIGNNVKIDFQCFAGGIAFGLGSIFYILYNGLNIGTVAGYLTHLGLVATFWGFVAGHSSFELLGIVFSGAAGLKMGLALIAPGRRTRVRSLQETAGEVVMLLYGAASMTFIAAFIEAFWSPLGVVSTPVKVTVGLFFWVALLAYFLLAGRSVGRRDVLILP